MRSIRGDLGKLLIFGVITAIATLVVVVPMVELRIRDVTTYKAVFEDVSALKAGQPVLVAGVEVGKVKELEIVEGNKVLVTFSVVSSRPLTKATRATVRYENLIGDRYLEIREGPGSPQRLKPGGVIPVTQTAPALDLDVLFNGFKPLFAGLAPDDINKLSYELITVLQGQGGTIESLLGRAASLSSTLAEKDQVIGQLVDNLNALLGTVDERDQKLRATISELQTLVSGLAADREPLGVALDQINTLTGSVGGLLVDARPPLQGTVKELGRTADILNRNQPILNEVLRGLPEEYAHLQRLGAGGSFFNFYLCSVQIKVSGPSGPILSPVFGSNSNTPRCRDRGTDAGPNASGNRGSGASGP
jgi:phospholipid/cholesterol/gamma-HCH transport system substrate-binding protein